MPLKVITPKQSSFCFKEYAMVDSKSAFSSLALYTNEFCNYAHKKIMIAQ